MIQKMGQSSNPCLAFAAMKRHLKTLIFLSLVSLGIPLTACQPGANQPERSAPASEQTIENTGGAAEAEQDGEDDEEDDDNDRKGQKNQKNRDGRKEKDDDD